MKQFYFPILTMLLSISIFGQERLLQGNVLDGTTNEALPGVTILVKGTSIGTVTGVNGEFSLKVSEGNDVLIFSYVGFLSQEITIGEQTNLTVSLEVDSEMLDEVVVTAFGLKKETSKLGYSVQSVNAEDLERAADPNIGTALRGKLAGVNINSNAGGIGSSVSINVRGISSLGANNQPLIVLDGVIIDTNQGEQGDFAEGVDYGNTLSNLNPNDIENISLLKGGNATALYGFRGANGVLIINTKSGSTEKTRVEINSSVTFNTALVAPEFQNEYGQGRYDSGTDELVYDITAGTSWGPQLDGSSRERFDGVGNAPYQASGSDDFKDFFQTGISLLNSVAVSQAKNGYNYRLSYSRSDDESIVPGSELTRQNISLKTGAELTDRIRVTGKLEYIDQLAENRPELTGGQSNIVNALSIRPRNISNNLLEANTLTSAGTPNNWQGAFAMNPYYTVNNVLNQDQTDRYIALLEFEGDITDDLRTIVRVSQDLITIEQEIFNPLGAFDIAANGRYINYTSKSRVNNYDLIFAYDKVVSDRFSLSSNLGFSSTKTHFEATRSTGETFLVPNFYSLKNFESIQATPIAAESLSNSVFGTVTLGYNESLFVELTARNDWSSTLPEDNWSFFYPSVGVSYVLSDAIPGLSNGFLSYLKLRGSLAETGNATSPYQLANAYNTSSNLWNGQRFFFYGYDEEGAGAGTELKNPNLRPEISTALEFGFDARFLNNRVGINFTYYNIETEDQILNLTLPPSFGAASQVINAGLVSSKGLEITLNAELVKNANFSWFTTVNYTTNESKVEELADGIERNILVRQFNDAIQVAAEVGSSPQALFGSSFERNEQGEIIYDTDGLPVIGDIVKIGDAAPDGFANWSNTFTYKQFSLGVLFDARIGGDLYSFSEAGRHSFGTAVQTLEGREFYSGGNGIMVPEGTPIQDGGTLSDELTARGVDPQTYFGRLANISENWIYDGSFVKLREVSVGYSFPGSIVSKLKLSSMTLSYFGRNLAILHSNTDNFDPETGFNTSFAGVEYYGIPSARSHGFRLNITL